MLRFRTLAALALGAIVLTLAGACTGGGGQARTEEGLKRAAREATEAVFKGDYRAVYDSFAKECRDQVDYKEFEATTRLGVAFVEQLAGVKLKDFKVTGVEVRNFTKDGAEVSVTNQAPKAAEGFEGLAGAGDFEAWKWEDGRWVATNCSGLGGGAGDFGDSGPAPTVPPPGSGPKLGETVEAGKARVTVHAVEDPARAPDAVVEAGRRLVAVEVSIEAAKGSVSVATFDFTVQDEKGYTYDPAFFGREPALKMTDLAQGRTVRGWVTFDVPKDAKLVAVYADLDFPKPETLVADLTRK
jgi:hypothetical protein